MNDMKSFNEVEFKLKKYVGFRSIDLKIKIVFLLFYTRIKFTNRDKNVHRFMTEIKGEL